VSTDDSGWFSITIDDEEKHPRVILTAGGFPDEEVAMWFVEELEDFMQYLVSKDYSDSERIDLKTHTGTDTIN